MKCKFCGTKIGVFERWRYGDFCNEAHREEFAEDLNRLNAQIVKDLRRFSAKIKLAEVEEESDPAEAGLVAEAAPAPVRIARGKQLRQEAPALRAHNSEWQALARIAEWDDLPVAALAASRKRQSRFICLDDGKMPEDGPRGCLVAGARAVFLPSPELRQFRMRISMGGLKAAEKWSKPAVSSCGWMAAGGAPSWIDDQGWRWISEDGPAAAPCMEAVLADMPIRAPWHNWEFVAPRRGAGHASGGMSPGYGVLPFVGESYEAQPQPKWRLLAPPLFNALVDVAYGMAVRWGEGFALTAVAAIPPTDEPMLPVLNEMPRFGIHLVDCQDDLSSEERAAERARTMRKPLLNTLWRRHLNLPVAQRTMGRPRVPRQAAREVRLQMGVAPELTPAGIEAFARRRVH